MNVLDRKEECENHLQWILGRLDNDRVKTVHIVLSKGGDYGLCYIKIGYEFREDCLDALMPLFQEDFDIPWEYCYDQGHVMSLHYEVSGLQVEVGCHGYGKF